MGLQDEIERSTQVSFVSLCERRNARHQRYMEDMHAIIPCLDDEENTFYCSVFDGHGGKCIVFTLLLGTETAKYLTERLHANLIEARKSEELQTEEQCLEYAYYLTDIESKNEDLGNSGSTGVSVIILNEGGKRVLYSANVGDSRSILFSNSQATRLSYVC